MIISGTKELLVSLICEQMSKELTLEEFLEGTKLLTGKIWIHENENVCHVCKETSGELWVYDCPDEELKSGCCMKCLLKDL